MSARFITMAVVAKDLPSSDLLPPASMRSPIWMSVTFAGLAVFKSVCPGRVRISRVSG